MKKSALKGISIALAIGLVLGLGEIGFSQEAKGKPESRTGEIQGEISSIGKNYIAIVYKREKDKEYEILLPIEEKEVTLERKRSLSELNVGDTVRIRYEDVIGGIGQEQVMQRKARVISFIRPAPPKPPEPQE